ncbi:deoxyhypusine synthase family protein, partial [Candidatus Altiarchaeota archaeon]
MVRKEGEGIKDYNIDEVDSVTGLVNQMGGVGFQASNLSSSVDIIKRMKQEGCKIFLSFTANMLASGLRGCIVDLIRKGYVNAVLTTGGSIDHDIIRSYDEYLLGGFDLDDGELHSKGINRLGNILVPTERYETLEKIIQPWFEEYYTQEGKIVTPSQLISFLSSKIDKEDSFLYHCHKNNIPVFSPGITDSAVGLQLYFFKQDHKDFYVDVVGDLEPAINLA